MRVARVGLLVPVVVSVGLGLVAPVAVAAPGHSGSHARHRATSKPDPVTKAKVESVTTSSVALSWKNPSFKGFAGVTIRRAKGSTAPGSASGGTLVANVSPGHSSATATGLSANTKYSFALFARGADQTYSSRVTLSATTKVLIPAKVSKLSSTTTATSITLNWTNPTTAGFTGVMVRRAAGSKAPATPKAGSLVKNVAKPGHTVLDSGLASGKQFSYALFSHDGHGHYSAAATKSATTGIDTTPPAAVTAVQTTPGESQVALSWTNPSDSDFAGVMIRRAAGSTAPASPTAGALVVDTKSATTDSFTDLGGSKPLSTNSTYSYALFAYDASKNFAPAATNTVTTHVLSDVTSVSAAPTATKVKLTWANPADPAYAGVEILRTNGTTPPTSLSDPAAVVVADVDKPATTYTDTTLAPGSQYSYALFAHDSTADFAAGTGASASTTTSSNDAGAVSLCGTITSDQTWASVDGAGEYDLTCTLTVPVGVTLTVAPGTVVKGVAGATLEVKGSLIGGNKTGPTTYFTSTNDNNEGPGAAGSSGNPQAGDWGGIQADGTASVVNLAGIDLGYGVYGLQERQGELQLKSSDVHDWTDDGVYVSNTTIEPVIFGDDFEADVHGVGDSVEIEHSTVNLDFLQGATGSGGAVPAVLIGNGSLLGDSSTGIFTGLPLALQCTSNVAALTVPDGLTATFAAGSVIKGAASNACTTSDLEVRGDLEAVGQTGNVITFTSLNDDFAGHTGTGFPAPDDWTGIRADGADSVLDLNHVELDYADYGAQVRQGTLTLRNSSVFDTYESAAYDSTSAVEPLIANNTFTNIATLAGPTVEIEKSNVDFDELGGNTGTGGQNRAILIGGGSISDTSAAVTFASSNLPLALTNCAGGSSLTIAAGTTLTLSAGSTVKSFGSTTGNNPCTSNLDVFGNLVLNGGTTTPVTFTSYNDQNVGGNTGTNNPQVGDWTGILAESGSSVTGTNVAINYAHYGIDDQGGAVDVSGIMDQDKQALQVDSGHVAFRGTISNTPGGISACNWGDGCTVDATYTQWGSSDGPFPGSGPLVCGAVLVSPWTDEAGVSDNAFESPNCDNSATPDVIALNAAHTLDSQLTDEDTLCDGGTGSQSACDAATAARSCLADAQTSAANGYPAPVDTNEATAVGAANEFISEGSDYLSSNASADPGDTDAVHTFAGQINKISGTVAGLGASFDNCDPE